MTNTMTDIELFFPRTASDYVDVCLQDRLEANIHAVLDAGCGVRVCRFGNPVMIVAARVWDYNVSQDLPVRVVLTSDGVALESSDNEFGADLPFWCRCTDLSADDWLYYEKWSPRGRVSHGWACPDCRGIVQVG